MEKRAMDWALLLIGILVFCGIAYVCFLILHKDPQCIKDPIVYAEKITNLSCGCFQQGFYGHP